MVGLAGFGCQIRIRLTEGSHVAIWRRNREILEHVTFDTERIRSILFARGFQE